MPKTASDRLYIDKELREAFHYYAEDEKLRVPEELRGAITEEWLMRETLKNQVMKMGHYPLKTKQAITSGSPASRDPHLQNISSNKV